MRAPEPYENVPGVCARCGKSDCTKQWRLNPKQRELASSQEKMRVRAAIQALAKERSLYNGFERL